MQFQWEQGDNSLELAVLEFHTKEVGAFCFCYLWRNIYNSTEHELEVSMLVHSIAGWWFVFFIFPYIGKNHPNPRTPSFFRGVGQPPTRLDLLSFLGFSLINHQFWGITRVVSGSQTQDECPIALGSSYGGLLKYYSCGPEQLCLWVFNDI